MQVHQAIAFTRGAMDETPTRAPAKSRGFFKALWSLWTPDRFESLKPTHRGLLYRERAGRGTKPKVDVYLPDTEGPHASVILIHGGGYIIGSRHMKPMRYLASHLNAAGFAVASMDYRLVFRGGRFDEALVDVVTMTDWWFDQQEAFGLDPKRVSMLGVSAGSALMLMSLEESGRGDLHRLISVYGLHDFQELGGRAVRWLRKRVFRSADPKQWAKYSPIKQSKTACPLLILHGTADRIVPVEHAERLAEIRRSLDLPTELRLSPEAPHGFLNDASDARAQKALEDLLDFLATDVAKNAQAH